MTLKKHNEIQVKLICASDLEPIVWIRKYSQKYRNIIKKGVIDVNEIKKRLY